jgi:hypothetical protein
MGANRARWKANTRSSESRVLRSSLSVASKVLMRVPHLSRDSIACVT